MRPEWLRIAISVRSARGLMALGQSFWPVEIIAATGLEPATSGVTVEGPPSSLTVTGRHGLPKSATRSPASCRWSPLVAAAAFQNRSAWGRTEERRLALAASILRAGRERCLEGVAGDLEGVDRARRPQGRLRGGVVADACGGHHGQGALGRDGLRADDGAVVDEHVRLGELGTAGQGRCGQDGEDGSLHRISPFALDRW